MIGIIRFYFNEFFKPRFKVGDVVISEDIEFPEKHDYLCIVNVGKKKYQYKYQNGSGYLYESSIWFIDSEYKLKDQDNDVKASGQR